MTQTTTDEIRRLRATLARIEGACEFNASAATDPLDRLAFVKIGEMAQSALGGPVCEDCGMRHADPADCIEGHGDD